MPKAPQIILGEFLPYRLSVASNAVSSLIAQAYEERFQLSVAEWRLIAILREEVVATPLQISRKACLDKISVTRAAHRLKDRGLVSSRKNQNDGRSHFLELTPAGCTLYDRVAPVALELEAKLLRHFTTAEISTLTDLLSRIQAEALGERG